MYLALVHLRHQLCETGMDLLEPIVDGLAGYPLLTSHICAELHVTVDGVDQIDLVRGHLLHCQQKLSNTGVFTHGIFKGTLMALWKQIHRIGCMPALVGAAVSYTHLTLPTNSRV